MKKIYNSVEELIGKTPLLRLNNIEKELSLHAEILAKLEFLNPAGSVKDRAALKMLDDAEASGALKKGATVIEPTSGNTGIGLSMVASLRGYKAIIVMPDNMSIERRQLMSAYGAEVVLTPAAGGMTAAIAKAEELAREIEGAFIPAQFDNPSNAAAHFETTGPEIYEDTDGKIDIFVAGVGTGGTVTGIGEYLKSKNPDIKIVGVEPSGSAILSGGKAGAHKLQGIGAGFVPKVLNEDILDEIIAIDDDDAYDFARKLCKKEGILVGISSGAAALAAVTLASLPENEGKRIVVLLPDTGSRYLSTLFV